LLSALTTYVIQTQPEFLTNESQQFLNPINMMPLGSLVLITAAFFSLIIVRGQHWAIPILLAIGLIDQAMWGFRAINVQTYTDLNGYKQAQNPPPGAPNGRVLCSDTDGDGLMLLGWSYTNGYVGLTPPRSLDYSTEEAQILSATSWRRVGNEWLAVRSWPRIRFLSTAGQIQIISDRPGHLELVVNSSGPQQLMFAENYHPSWQVRVDDQPVPFIRVQTDFMGVDLLAGQHHVVFHFDPQRRTWGRWLSFSALGLSLLAALWFARRESPTMK